MFPKKVKPKNEMSVEEYNAAVKAGNVAFPKKSLMQQGKSKTMKAVCPESALQVAANDLILLKGWKFIRFPDWLLRWIVLNAPVHVRKCFFDQVGGKFSDNIIQVDLGEGFFLGCKMELKTEDSKGRAVGQLHGKQKHYAKEEGWQIARNTKQIEEILKKIENYAEKIKNITH